MAPLTARQLAALAVEGPGVAVHGLVSGCGDGPGTPLRVWAEGPRVRVEGPDGRPRVLADAESVWDFGEEDLPLHGPRSAWPLIGPTGTLMRRLALSDVLAGRFSRPDGAPVRTEFCGRDAWAQRYAEPTTIAPTPGEVELVLDAETGWPLRIESPSGGAQWDEFTVGSDPAAPGTTWTGPLRTRAADEPYDHEQQRADVAERAAGREWFAAEIGVGRSVRTEVQFSVEVRMIHEFDPATGRVQATLDVVLGNRVLENRAPVVLQVDRRPRCEELAPGDWRATAFGWRTERFEWAAEWGFRDLGPDALQAVATLLSEDQEVVR